MVIIMIKDFRSEVDVMCGHPKKRPMVMKEETFYSSVMPNFEKVSKGMYQSKKTGKIVEFISK